MKICGLEKDEFLEKLAKDILHERKVEQQIGAPTWNTPLYSDNPYVDAPNEMMGAKNELPRRVAKAMEYAKAGNLQELDKLVDEYCS
ncbi:hypothetical protein [Desulfovibrio inopinatus]|uniref:hypothetical protein n=1 Tax=Desulfovibrio inopinatus TaxID=102109 RepID=UPI00040CBFA0|nr:hypothetical protein [Desulfovibrio inopinatus]